MRDESDFPGDDPLDRLLAGAEWPDPDPLRLARLQREWDHALLRERQRSRRIRLALAAAAVFVTALGLWWISAGAPHEQLVAPHERERETALETVESRPRQADSHPGAGRAPTAYELLVLRAHDSRRATPRSDPLERTIQNLLSDSEADIDELVSPLLARRTIDERRLLQSIPNASGERQIAELRILAAIGSSRSVPLLAQLSRSEPTRSAAVDGLKRLADSVALAKLASVEPDQQTRRELLTILLDRGDTASAAAFLDTVGDPRTTASAVAAFENSRQPPVDSLVSLLSAGDTEQKAAAAGLLGRTRHPEVIARLVALAKQDSTRQPALMALLASDDPQARRFLAELWAHPQMRSAVQLAQLQWQVAAWHVSVPTLPEVY